jgi:hypothetical protein
MIRSTFSFCCALALAPLAARAAEPAPAVAPREHTNFDAGWRFALGHPSDPARDFDFGTAYFSYLAKAGYGDGPTGPTFDDRGWRQLDLPHDRAVEAPFTKLACSAGPCASASTRCQFAKRMISCLERGTDGSEAGTTAVELYPASGATAKSSTRRFSSSPLGRNLDCRRVATQFQQTLRITRTQVHGV